VSISVFSDLDFFGDLNRIFNLDAQKLDRPQVLERR
jgi:hypothetical protein